jgi:hypothetical protein
MEVGQIHGDNGKLYQVFHNRHCIVILIPANRGTGQSVTDRRLPGAGKTRGLIAVRVRNQEWCHCEGQGEYHAKTADLDEQMTIVTLGLQWQLSGVFLLRGPNCANCVLYRPVAALVLC